MEEAENLCTRIGLMDGGKLIELDTPQRLIEKTGKIVLEYFHQGTTKRRFFLSEEEAVRWAAGIQGRVKIRPANLEDIFVCLTN